MRGGTSLELVSRFAMDKICGLNPSAQKYVHKKVFCFVAWTSASWKICSFLKMILEQTTVKLEYLQIRPYITFKVNILMLVDTVLSPSNKPVVNIG